MTALILVIFLLIFPISFTSASYNKYNNNPIIIPYTSWNTRATNCPNMLFNGITFQSWFSGFDGTTYQIGYAESLNGYEWTYPVISPVISRINPNNKNAHEPSVVYENGLYTMWFAGSDVGPTNFFVYRAISLDGRNWTIDPITPVYKPISGWSSKSASSPFVLKNSSKYYLWFTSSDNNKWEIGEAESNDGINWTPYAQNPVLSGDKPWDGTQVGGPTVLYEDGVFKMWYGTNTNINPRINYATSTDGVNWTKNQDENPVITQGPAGTWDANSIGDGSAIRIGDQIFFYYGANGTYNSISASRIGLASDKPFIDPSPIPTATPTPTITPTPEPTPTHTPTPSPSPSPIPSPTPTEMPVNKPKVIFAPGFGGSWNMDALIGCKTSNYSGNWELLPHYGELVYQPIMSEIADNGYELLPFYYDWRQDPRLTGIQLNEFINSNTSTNDSVYFIGHSMGGLIGRAYIEENKANSVITKYISVGTPHHGTPNAYPAWSAGILYGDLNWKIAGTILKTACRALNKPFITDSEIVKTYIPSVQFLLPDYPYLIDHKTRFLIPLESMTAKNPWLTTDSFLSPFFGLNIKTITGSNNATLEHLIIRKPNHMENKLKIWADGRPIRQSYTINGDGTVLISSAILEGAFNKNHDQFNANHSGIISNPEPMNRIMEILGSQAGLNLTENPEPKTALVFAINEPGSLEITYDDKNIKDKNGLIIIENPKPKKYKLSIKPSLKKRTLITIQILEDDVVLPMFYSFNPAFSKIYKNINFNPKKLQADIFK